MEQDTQVKITELETKIAVLETSVHKIRTYFKIIVWVSVIMFVLPLLGMLIAIPAFLNTYNSALGGLI